MDKHFLEIERSVNFIEANLQNEIDVLSVCSMSTYSPWQFQRMFRALTGDSIGKYIRGRRLSLALDEIIKAPKKRIIDIAIQFQFSSHEAFSRAFKKQFKLNPGEVRINDKKTFVRHKPALNKRRLFHVVDHVEKDPVFKTIKDLNLIGTSISVDSSFGNETVLFEKIKNHWKEFNSLRHKCPPSINSNSYGVVSDLEQSLDGEKLKYFSSVAIDTNAEYPDNFDLVNLKEQEYAVFKVTGNHSSCQVTADYIYGFWFPQSSYTRDTGFDFELFDESFDLRTNSVSYYHVPVRKLS